VVDRFGIVVSIGSRVLRRRETVNGAQMDGRGHAGGDHKERWRRGNGWGANAGLDVPTRLGFVKVHRPSEACFCLRTRVALGLLALKGTAGSCVRRLPDE
jgi:hypothetical protein